MIPSVPAPADGCSLSSSTPQQHLHLVLHFDINETVLVGDEAGGDTAEECLNKLLAKSAYVQCPKELQGTMEGMETFEPSFWWDGQPILENNDATALSSLSPPPPLHTDWEWPTNCCPYYRTSFKKYAKAFTHHHGIIYRPIYDRLSKIMAPRDDAFSLIVPSFFHTLAHLSQHYNTNWTLVFRTFGTDLSSVATAISLFAQGKHPDYPDFYDERLVNSRLFRGRWIADKEKNGDVFSYQLQEGDVVVAQGDAEVLDILHNTASTALCGIQDHYEHWNGHDCQPWAGKPVWIPLNRDDDKQYLHILFDDNIHNLEFDSIAGIRKELQPGVFESLSGRQVQELQGLHLVRVPTTRVILENDWFLQSIEKAKKLFLQQQDYIE